MPKSFIPFVGLFLVLVGCGGQQATLDQLNKCNEDYRALAERMAARPAATAAAASKADAGVFERAEADLYVDAITEAGYEIRARTDRFIQIDMYGLKVQLFPQETSAQLFAGFTASSTLSPVLINDWNRTKRFSRAYIDQEGDPVLESDIDLEGGITKGSVVTWIQTFAISLRAFNNMLFEAANETSL